MNSRDLRRDHGGNYNNYGNQNRTNKRGGPARNHVIPTEPPFTAYIGNAPDSMVQGDFEHHLFVGIKVKQVRLVRDRQTDRFRGFAYVDFEDADSLRSAIALDGTFVNDQPIRIDVASRPLGATKTEGFRNKTGFQSRGDSRPQLSGHNNNNRSGRGFRYDEHGNNQQRNAQISGDCSYGNGYNDDYYNEDKLNDKKDSSRINERKSQSDKEPSPPTSRKVSDDVFITSDITTTMATTNDNESQEHSDDKAGLSSMTRQHTRNWADCPIDDSVVETSPTFQCTSTQDVADNFQNVRDKIPKSQTLPRLMSNQLMRGRNDGNYSRGLPSSQTSTGDRTFYDQLSYANEPQQYYHHHPHHNSQMQQPPVPMNLLYHHNRNQTSAGSRQRSNFNKTNNNRNYRDDPSDRDEKRLTSATSNTSAQNTNTVSAENRPRLQLLPRTQKSSSPVDDKKPAEGAVRNSSIFGLGKARDEYDPKLMELSKHIEEIVEQEQHVARTKSTTSNDSTQNIIKPVRILSSRSESSTDH
ncbi:unnamed protein product [Rotaria magnacalcarata]|uniref:RRM domain-containing protein n=3 Tax=Rotaria magnacalcarata TaxID=392030 RepID=A0A816MIU0_9BILA|nr:unnamed protein product [Rotaria magnacalcarata]CAF1996558.1 unnamed protein product [Rotaria magnacalcarata]